MAAIPPQIPTRFVPVLTSDEVNSIRTPEDIVGILARNPTREYLEVSNPSAPPDKSSRPAFTRIALLVTCAFLTGLAFANYVIAGGLWYAMIFGVAAALTFFLIWLLLRPIAKNGPPPAVITKLLDGPMDIELFKASIESGRAAIRSGFLVNGAGAIALLTLIGNLAKDGYSSKAIHSLALPLGCFAVGASLAMGASGLTSLAQPKFQSYNDPLKIASGVRMRTFIMFMLLFAYSVFVLGCFFAYCAFTQSF